jgi:hypothetical protein
VVVLLTNFHDQPAGILRNRLIMITPASDSAKGSSIHLWLNHISGDCGAPNHWCFEEFCRSWTEDRVGTLVSGNRWSYMGSNCVFRWFWININIQICHTSWKHTLYSWYSVVLGFCIKVSGRWSNIVCRTSSSLVWVCWITICMQTV